MKNFSYLDKEGRSVLLDTKTGTHKYIDGYHVIGKFFVDEDNNIYYGDPSEVTSSTQPIIKGIAAVRQIYPREQRTLYILYEDGSLIKYCSSLCPQTRNFKIFTRGPGSPVTIANDVKFITYEHEKMMISKDSLTYNYVENCYLTSGITEIPIKQLIMYKAVIPIVFDEEGILWSEVNDQLCFSIYGTQRNLPDKTKMWTKLETEPILYNTVTYPH